MNKTNVAIVFGGKSAEHDVSILTAHIPIIKTLQVLPQFKIIPVYIDKKGVWYTTPEMIKLDYFRDPQLEQKIAKLNPLAIQFNDGLWLITKKGWLIKKIKIDLVFPAMHGTFGEDGSLMGILRMAGVPFVGCDLDSSAIAMDKVLTKQIMTANNIPVLNDVWFTRSQWKNDSKKYKKMIAQLNWPLFIKPTHLGSSIAISKVTNQQELLNAIELAFYYDNKVLVEESITNPIEVTLPIMGNDELELANIERPLNKGEFFDFEKKYLSGGKQTQHSVNSQYSELPAKICTKIAEEIKKLTKQAYRAIGATGTARIDWLIDQKQNKVYLLEINTLPGSLYNHNWHSVGISDVTLISKLIQLAQERFTNQSQNHYFFSSPILQNVNGVKIQDN